MNETPIIVDVYQAADVVVADGVAIGDPISFADDLVLDDVYQLTESAVTTTLSLLGRDGHDIFSRDGQPDHDVYLDCCLTLMTNDGSILETLILVEVADGLTEAVYLLPLAPMAAQVNYRLVGIARHTATRRFAQATCGSFAGGTRITMHDGQLRTVETLIPGDLLMTRDNGPQPLRWIGKSTLRANGSFAPVVISAGTLNNDADLLVRRDHKLFVYQRSDELGAGRAEVLIRARHLIDGDTVYQRDGGFIDYYQLVLDTHQIIYAEGISAESQLVDARARPFLADDMILPDHAPTRLPDYEVASGLVVPTQAAMLLRRATTR